MDIKDRLLPIFEEKGVFRIFVHKYPLVLEKWGLNFVHKLQLQHILHSHRGLEDEASQQWEVDPLPALFASKFAVFFIIEKY